MRILLIFLFLPLFDAFAQDTISQELDSIQDISQAEQFLKIHSSKGNQIVTFNEENHETEMVKDLFARGYVTVESDMYITHYRVLERYSIPHYRVSYIYLDGTLMNDTEIQVTRNNIIKKFNEGIPFSQLAKQYSMDNNANKGGDLGWFSKGTYNEVFENALINDNHQVNDIFTMDIEENNWYYVVLKTYDVKQIREIKALKIVNPKD
jgi:parvulin-like peptidyl-prolyl isomerase